MIDFVFKPLKRAISKVEAIPFLEAFSPSPVGLVTEDDRNGYLRSQGLAQQCALEISALLEPGWTERQATRAMEIWLRDHGVKSFFHKPFAWWGSRSRFDGINHYKEFQATDRRLLENEPFILDVAPIVDGYISDIGFSGMIGHDPEFDRGISFLESLRRDIPEMVQSMASGGAVWKAVDQKLRAAGYDNIHLIYPMGVLGHRVYRTTNKIDATLLNFGWQSFWELASRGIFGQLLTEDYEGKLDGLWAVEPQIGGPNWGMKFEEILLVENGQARWLDPEAHWFLKRSAKK
jgi:Metallopeptidase family M24